MSILLNQQKAGAPKEESSLNIEVPNHNQVTDECRLIETSPEVVCGPTASSSLQVHSQVFCASTGDLKCH